MSRPPVTPKPKPDPEAGRPPLIETSISNKISNQLQHQINHEGKLIPANKQNRDVVERRIEIELSKGTMKRVVSLVDAVFHDLFLPVTPDQVIGNDALRLNNGWRLWPRTKETIPEDEMAAFINLIGETAMAFAPADSKPRYCSSMFERHGVSDPTWKTGYQPDNVFFKSFIHEMERQNVTWADILLALEIKSSKDKKKEAGIQSARYAHCIFTAQPGRRFVPAVTIAGHMVTLWIFDRSGSIASEAFNIHDDPRKFLRIILGILFVDSAHLGYDPSIYHKGSNSVEKYIKVNHVEYKVDCIYIEPGIKGRGTVCYHGVDQRDNSEVVIKDSWVDVARQETEVEVLNHLNEGDEASLCNSDGARVVPKIIAHEFRTTKRPCVTDGVEQLEDVKDTTAIFREHRLHRENGEVKWAWDSDKKKSTKKVEIRALCRIVMSPYGRKLETFTSLKVLMKGFVDVVHAIRILKRRGIIHRDISFRNILLHEHKGALHGLLIDYDYAVFIDRVSSDAIGERTGTLPFMAINRLNPKSSSPHRYSHDLESIFYVLCWLCTIYEGPLNQKRAFSKNGIYYHDTSVALWNGDTTKEISMQMIYLSKKLFAIGRKDFEELLEQFADYFKDIMGCFWRLRQLLFIPSPDDKDAYDEKKAQLDKRYADASLDQREGMKWDYNEVPITMRPPEVVLDSFTVAFNEVAGLLPEDEPTAAVHEVEGNAEYVNAGPRRVRVRDFIENVVPNALADIASAADGDDESESDSDESYVDEKAGRVAGPSRRTSKPSAASARISLKRKSASEPDGAPSSSKRSRTPVISGRRLPAVQGKGKARSCRGLGHRPPGPPGWVVGLLQPTRSLRMFKSLTMRRVRTNRVEAQVHM